jgi:two-component sensor histidine kinase
VSSEPSPSQIERLFPGKSEMAGRMRALDWSATPLGPPEDWPPDVQVAVRLCLTSGIAVLLFLGPELTMLYNDAYIPFLGETKHPRDLGRSGRECWSEIWDTVGPMAASVYVTGHATLPSDFELFFRRLVPREEVYERFTYGPIFGADGRTVAGIFCPCTETTEQVVGARRLETLRKLGSRSPEARTVDAACAEAVAVLGENPRDIPFAAIYTVGPTDDEATLGAKAVLGSEHHFPGSVSLRDDGSQSPWPLAQVMRTRRPVECADLPAAGVRIPGAAWSEPTERAILLPIEGAQDRLSAILVAGVSPRRPLDAAYRTFLDLVAGHVAKSISDAQAYEAERERAEKLARIDAALRVSLAQQQALMKEVHHRVKNNLEVVNSLLMLQSDYIADAKLKSVLVETANRVRVIADIHRMLYAAPKLDQVDLGRFVQRLADFLFALYSGAGARVRLELSTEQLTMDLQRAVPIGLILNELFSNSLEHAFPGSRQGHIRVRVDASSLEFSDDGVGLPPSFDPDHPPLLGLQLVKILVEQIGGTWSVQSGPGTRFSVKFPPLPG